MDDDCHWFLCMNPLQSSLLYDAEFLEMDVTFENCRDYPYLLNVTRFSYATMKCMIKMTIIQLYAYSCNHLQGLLLLESECQK